MKNIEEIFEKLNKEFNFIICQESSKFHTSFRFQIIQYLYNNKLYELDYLKKSISAIEGNTTDYFEKIFIKLFFKKCISKNKKISKTNYLINLISNISSK